MRKLKVPQNVPDTDITKSKILMESARMFAVSGYSTVSIRDIAEAVGIMSGSIYSHFKGKQDILESIMQMCERELQVYYEMQKRLALEAESFTQILKNLFVESVEVVNPFCYYALYIASTNQFEFQSCRHIYFDIYFKEGHEVAQQLLSTAIERKLSEPFNVPAISSLIMNCILNMVDITVGRQNGFYQEFDIMEWYNYTIQHILQITNRQ